MYLPALPLAASCFHLTMSIFFFLPVKSLGAIALATEVFSAMPPCSKLECKYQLDLNNDPLPYLQYIHAHRTTILVRAPPLAENHEDTCQLLQLWRKRTMPGLLWLFQGFTPTL